MAASYDHHLLRRRYDESGLSYQEIADRGKTSKTTVSRALEGDSGLSDENLRKVCAGLGVPYAEVTASWRSLLPRLQGAMLQICEVCQMAVVDAMAEARAVILHGYVGPEVRTDPHKITDRPLDDDVTEPIDRVTSDAIQAVLADAHGTRGHPLSEGFHLFDEELGYVDRFVGRGGSADWVVFVDSADDTSQARRGLGGTSLIGVYHRRIGWAVVTIGDFSRYSLFSRIAGKHSLGLRLQPPATGPFEPRSRCKNVPEGVNISVEATRRDTVAGSAINLYMGKPSRILATAKLAAGLLADDVGVRETFSFGGSRGGLLVAEGVIDASVEVVKGFRPLDFAPGAFLAAGSSAAVLDLEGVPIDFGPDFDFERTLDRIIRDHARGTPIDPAIFDGLRKRFVIAATPGLGAQIVAALKRRS